MFFINNNVLLRPIAFGGAIGFAIGLVLYNTMPAYAAFIDWQLAHPLVWFIGLPIGVAAAVLTD